MAQTVLTQFLVLLLLLAVEQVVKLGQLTDKLAAPAVEGLVKQLHLAAPEQQGKVTMAVLAVELMVVVAAVGLVL